MSQILAQLLGLVGSPVNSLPLRHSGLRLTRVSLLLLLVGWISPGQSLAASLLYGDFMGSEAIFRNVKESSVVPLPLFGSPANAANLPGGYPPCVLADSCTISGNSLFFSPQQFIAESNSQLPTPVVSVDGQLTFQVESKPGQSIQNLRFDEAGLFDVTGINGTTTDATSARVLGVGNVTVLEIDGNASIVPLVIPINFSFIFDTGVGGQNLAINEWHFVTEGDKSGAWRGGQVIDITQALLDAGRSVELGATKIDVNLDNRLRAKSESQSLAAIDKKLHLIVTVNAPEPGSCSLALLVVALGGLLVHRSRFGVDRPACFMPSR
jgi:hypothetical protein